MMEKIKKLVTNFSIGITVLILSYIMLYYMAGEAAYRQDISSLQNINSLIMQCIWAGVFYIFFHKILEYVIRFVSPEYAKEMTFANMFKFIGITLFGIPLISVLLGTAAIPEVVEMLYYFNAIMLMIILPIISLITQCIEVNKINKALKNREKNINSID